MFKRVTLALLALMLLVVVGCSKAPEAEMTAASAAFDAARAAEAEGYVPDAFRMAQDTLNAAQAEDRAGWQVRAVPFLWQV